MAHQSEAVNKRLDWRQEVRRRPVAWSLGALGAGFLAGYGIAAVFRGNGRREDLDHLAAEQAHSAHPGIAEAGLATHTELSIVEKEERPGFFERFKETPAYHRLRKEAAAVGNHFVDELTKTAKEVVLPAMLGKIKQWLEAVIPETTASFTSRSEIRRTRSSTHSA